jgi:hypothetical protein
VRVEIKLQGEFAMEEPHITIDTYQEHMCEAFSALRSGLSFLQHAEGREEDDAERHWLYLKAGMQCRYAFLLAANALEAAANALLLDLGTSRALYGDFEKLQTLLKFEVVCLARGKKLDRGNELYARMKEVVKCRNEFVHPKPRKVTGELTQDGRDVEIKVAKTKARCYPTSFSLFEPKHALEAIGDILAFVSWIVFDVCEHDIQDGSMRLGHGSRISSGDVILLGKEYGFDTRSFGERE